MFGCLVEDLDRLRDVFRSLGAWRKEMKKPGKLGFFNQFSLASQRIRWCGPFAGFRAPRDEGVWEVEGGNWIGGFERRTEDFGVMMEISKLELSEAKALYSFPGCCRRH